MGANSRLPFDEGAGAGEEGGDLRVVQGEGLVQPPGAPTPVTQPGAPPDVDWADLDSVVTPWLSGEAFPDKVGLSFWPLPVPA